MPPPPPRPPLGGGPGGGGRGGAESEGQNSPPPTSTRHALQLHRLMHDGPKKQKPFTAGAARAHTEKKRRGKEQHWARGRRVACAQQGGLCGPTTPRGAPKFHTRDDMKPLVAHTCSADADNYTPAALMRGEVPRRAKGWGLARSVHTLEPLRRARGCHCDGSRTHVSRVHWKRLMVHVSRRRCRSAGGTLLRTAHSTQMEARKCTTPPNFSGDQTL